MIVPSSAEKANERLLDWCFCTRPQADDWSSVLARPQMLDLSALVKEIESIGPEHALESLDTDLRVWRLQQRIRLAVRHQQKLPLVTRCTCSRCGVRPTDPTLQICLHCADLSQQMSHFGSRGNCHFLIPAYDPTKRCWSLLSYRSFLTNERAPILLYVASGFEDYSTALEAVLPLSNYARLIQKTSSDYQDVFRVIDYLEMISGPLPMAPVEWAEFSRRQILQHYAQHDPNSIERILDDALRAIESNESRADRTADE